MKFIDQMNLAQKTVLVRMDFNVPIKDSEIQDDSRIKASLDTIKYLLEQNSKIILCSHMGKPKEKAVPELSLKPVAKRLEKLLDKNVHMAPDCIGPEVKDMVDKMQPGEILLLENLRFHSGETKNDPEFSKGLAELADVYLSDAFGVVHRAHASVAGVTDYAKEVGAGFLLKKEVEYLGKALANPERPFVLISGGAKVSTKIGVLDNLLNKVNRIVIGGAMANTFRKSQGYNIGNSKVENELLEDAKEIMKKAMQNKVSFYLPVDYVAGSGPDAQKPTGLYPFQDLPEGEMILDIGPASHTLFAEALKDAGTIVWNGPMGAFENPPFSQGSVGLAQHIADLNALTIVGGGDTDSLIHSCNITDKIDFISTGGGSFLEFMEGKELPGLKALEK